MAMLATPTHPTPPSLFTVEGSDSLGRTKKGLEPRPLPASAALDFLHGVPHPLFLVSFLCAAWPGVLLSTSSLPGRSSLLDL